jgi:glyoxylase-like metal-dependent hydrolase (beta-lactamase superfamily II)
VAVKVHAISTGQVAVRERQREGSGPDAVRPLLTMLDRTWSPRLPILMWVIEHPEGLIVVDAGETARATLPGWFPRWHPYFRLGVREWVTPDEEAGPAMRRLGLDPQDVRWVLMTHLHTDHAGGLEHFPASEILIARIEVEHASGAAGKLRGYLPHRWPDWLDPTLVDFTPRPYGPFPESFTVTQAGDVHLVRTAGHTPGHVSVVLEEDGGRVVFLAGDTSYTQELMLRGAIDGVCPEPAAARETLDRIRRLAAERPTVYLPTHDPDSAERLEARQPVA